MASIIKKYLDALEKELKGKNWAFLAVKNQIFVHGPSRSIFKPDTLAVIRIDENGKPTVEQTPAGCEPFTLLIKTAISK